MMKVTGRSTSEPGKPVRRAPVIVLAAWLVAWSAGRSTGQERQEAAPPATASPATAPSMREGERPLRPRPMRPGLGDRPRWPGQGGEGPAYSDADWTEASEFVRTHSPRRFEVFELLPDDSPQKRSVRRFMLTRYQNLKDFKASDPDSYDSKLKRLELEDDVFGLAVDLRRAQGSRRDELRTTLRSKVGEMIDLGIAERQQKISRLEKLLQEERDRLTTYQKGRDVLIEQRMEQEITAPGGPLMPVGPQGNNQGGESPEGAREAVADGLPGAAR